MVHKAVEKFFKQIDVKTADQGAGKVDVVYQTGAAGKVDDHTAQCFIQRNIGMAVTGNAGFIAKRLFQGLTQYDTDVFNGVMVVNVQIAFAGNIQVNQTMTRYLGKHMLKERNADVKAVFAGTVKIEADGDLGFAGIAGNGNKTALG